MLLCSGLRLRLIFLVCLIALSGCMHPDRRRPAAPAPPPPAPIPLPPPAAPAPQPMPISPTAEVPAIPPTATQAPPIAPPRPPGSAPAPTAPAASSAVIPASASITPASPPTSVEALQHPGDLDGRAPLPVPTVDPFERIQTLARLATEAIAPVETYTARLRRREQVNGRDNPEEIIAFQFRKQPWSVHFKWIGTEGHGREVIYVKGHYQDQLHTLLGDNDMGRMLFPKISLPLDDPKIRAHSRHNITEAGLGSLIGRFSTLVATEAKPGGGVKYLGMVQRPEYPGKVEGVEQIVGRDTDPLMPGGGRRLWYFDPGNHFPVLIVTLDATGHEVEYYCYDRLFINIHLDDDDFNPDKLGTRPH